MSQPGYGDNYGGGYGRGYGGGYGQQNSQTYNNFQGSYLGGSQGVGMENQEVRKVFTSLLCLIIVSRSVVHTHSIFFVCKHGKG